MRSRSASALTRLVGNRAYGVNATIKARFSQGVPWPISIITYDPPTQAAVTGTTASFAIPTQFRGDQLATMAATYADVTPAGLKQMKRIGARRLHQQHLFRKAVA